MVVAAYQLRVDWDDDGVFTGTGETFDMGRVLRVSFRRGRDYPSQLTGKSIAGIFRATLNNESGDYSSFNTASPLTGNVLPGRDVEFLWGSPLADTIAWTGKLLRLTPDPITGRVKTATLEAVGPLGFLNSKARGGVRVPMRTNVRSDLAIAEILDQLGWPAGDRALQVGLTTMTRWWALDKNAIAAMREVEETETGFLFETRAGAVAFHNRHARLVSPFTVSQATWSDDPADAISYRRARQEDPLRSIFNIFEPVVRTYTVAGVAALWTLGLTGVDSPGIAPGVTQVFWAAFPNLASATNAVSVDAWTTPVATTDYVANSAADGSGDDMTVLVTVAVTKFSNAMRIAITNPDASRTAFMTLLQARGTGVTEDDPARLLAEDAASQADFGEREYPSPPAWIPTAREAQDWAEFQLANYKDPVPIIRVRINANRDAAHQTEVLARDIPDRITLKATSTRTQLGIDEDFFVEAEQHDIRPGRFHEVTYDLSPASATGDWWILDISALDTNTKLAY